MFSRVILHQKPVLALFCVLLFLVEKEFESVVVTFCPRLNQKFGRFFGAVQTNFPTVPGRQCSAV